MARITPHTRGVSARDIQKSSKVPQTTLRGMKEVSQMIKGTQTKLGVMKKIQRIWAFHKNNQHDDAQLSEEKKKNNKEKKPKFDTRGHDRLF
jgi:hypothetical protein